MAAPQAFSGLPEFSTPPTSTSVGYEISLEIRSGTARLTLSGVLDAAAADAVGGMIGADGPVQCAVELIADAVAVADVAAAELLVAVARERRQRGLPAIRLIALSEPLSEALSRLGLASRPPIVL